MAESPSRGIMFFGTAEAVDAPRLLTAGPLSAELQNGEVRHLSYNGVEVLRGISFLVRDAAWATYAPEITNQAVEESSSGFLVSYDGKCSDARQSFHYRAEIIAGSDGALSFKVTGQAETEFETNRLGFVVLHPLAGVAGQPVQVENTDGETLDAQFPRYISPSQPIYDIRSLTHRVAGDIMATCTMVGDGFEMEDQRNWTDASFKTYIRPLSKPRPYTMAQGAEVEQSVSLAFSGTAPPRAQIQTSGAVDVNVGSAAGGTIPQIGLALAAEFGEASLKEAARIKALGPQFMVCEFDARRDDAEVLRRHQSFCDAVGAEAVLELIVAAEAEPAEELVAAASVLADAGFRPTSVSIFPAPYMQSRQPEDPRPQIPPFSAYYAAARTAFPGCAIGGGSYSYFTELNRARNGGEDGLDYITHTTCPIVHDAEDGAVMESIEALPHVFDSTRQFSGGVPYRIGPSNLGMRYRPYGVVPPLENPANVRLAMARVDPRQRGLFGAAWHLGYVAEAARGGLEAVALSAPVGPFGVIYCKGDFAQPFYDEADDAPLYPVYHVLAGMAQGAGRPMLDATSSKWSRVQCIAWQGDRGPELWLANLTPEAQSIAIGGLGEGPLQVHTLDAEHFSAAASNATLLQDGANAAALTSPISLDAYGVARVLSTP